MSNHTKTDCTNNSNSDDCLGPTTLYGYIPTFWICVVFLTLYGLSSAIHLFQAIFVRPRMLWLIPTAVTCGLCELLGWSGRTWSSQNSENHQAFLMQISVTIIAPVFLTAALYIILGLLISEMGHQYSRLKPKTYLKIFVGIDFFSLVVQGAGGGIASSANSDSGQKLGTDLVIGGIFIQLIGMAAYSVMAFEVVYRYYNKKPVPSKSESLDDVPVDSAASPYEKVSSRAYIRDRNMGLMVLGLIIATVLIFIRSIYRTAEMIDGWQGTIIHTQVYFNVFDATAILIALFTLNVLSPTWLLRPE